MGVKAETPVQYNTLSRNPREFSEFVNELILDLRDVLI
jgi:hypothetical protein